MESQSVNAQMFSVEVSSRLLQDLERSVVVDLMESNGRKTFLRDDCKTVNGFLKISHGLFSTKIFTDNSLQEFSWTILHKSSNRFSNFRWLGFFSEKIGDNLSAILSEPMSDDDLLRIICAVFDPVIRPFARI